MRNNLAASFMVLFLLSCGNIKESCSYCAGQTEAQKDNGEMVGNPIRPLEMPVPGSPELPTPAAALSMSGLPSAGPVDFSALYSSGVILSSVGFYSRGKIWSYEQVQTNDLWTVRNPKRAFANYFVVDYMRQAARAYLRTEPTADLLKIWDISAEGGGAGSGHLSHQLGLDVDVEYPYMSGTTRKVMSAIDFDKTWSLVKSFVATGQVQRMFMDTYIKKHMCALAKNDADLAVANETLRRLRYWPNHQDHVHFRFYCQRGDKLCVPQDEVPKGTGCPN